jgi:capsule polysaccharide export protein KpsE/RkpR
VTHSGSAPVRQPIRDFPEQELPETHHVPQDSFESTERPLAHLRTLWAHRRALTRVGGLAVAASTAIAFLIPARYESTARLMPPDNQSTSGLAMAAAAMSGATGNLGGLAGELMGLKRTSDVFAGVLASRTVQDRLIQQFDLMKVYDDRGMEDTRKDLEEHTSISVDRKSQIVSITVTDKRPQRAAAMGQAYVQELNRLVAELSTSSARRERIFLEERLKAVNQDLETAEKDFSQFASKNTAIDIKEQGKAMVEAAALLQGQLIGAQSQYEGLRQIYTDNNPRVRTVKARIDELQRQLEKLGGKGEGVTSVSAQLDSMYPSIRKLPLLGVSYADLYRRTKIQEVVLETLTKEYEMAKVQEAKEIPTVKVLDQANIPDKKSFPPRLLIVFFGTALALVLAAAWLFGKTSWEKTDSSDPRKAFAREVFATVKANLPKFTRNGSGNAAEGDTANWFSRHGNEDATLK